MKLTLTTGARIDMQIKLTNLSQELPQKSWVSMGLPKSEAAKHDGMSGEFLKPVLEAKNSLSKLISKQGKTLIWKLA